MRIEEPVQVQLSAGGAPVRFRWRGVVYAVTSSPEPWISRQNWWQLVGRAPRGGGSRLLEVQMWRVDAVPLTDGTHRIDGTFDLCRNPLSLDWQLSNAFDDVLDTQLFA
jgi:Family of unknown function (DUF6504)